jgi:hypothetical protein
MKLKVNRVDVWTVAIEDRSGGAAEKLEPLAQAGATFEFVLARRTPERPGAGILFVAPVKGAKVTRVAQAIGLAKREDICSVRIEGTDRPGAMAGIARALADAGISFRGLSATAIGRKFVGYLALDTADAAAKAASALKKLS